jgi:hypothetical protein
MHTFHFQKNVSPSHIIGPFSSKVKHKVNMSKHPFLNGIAGKDWYHRLKHRHQELALRKPAKLSTARSKVTEETTKSYLMELGSVLETNQIKNPETIRWQNGEHFDHCMENL